MSDEFSVEPTAAPEESVREARKAQYEPYAPYYPASPYYQPSPYYAPYIRGSFGQTAGNYAPQQRWLLAFTNSIVTFRLVQEEALRIGVLVSSLSARERAVLDLIIAGSLNKQIASSLGIAERTVKLHRANLMSKLNVRSPAQLGQIAEQLRERSGLTRFLS